MPIIPAEADEMDALYAEPESPAAAAPEEAAEAPETIDAEEADGATAVIDNKVLSPEGKPLKAGDQVILRVVRNLGDESEVAYGSAEAESAPMGGMAGAEAELDEMGMEA
jgi:thiamine biosynthesis protein ThiC